MEDMIWNGALPSCVTESTTNFVNTSLCHDEFTFDFQFVTTLTTFANKLTGVIVAQVKVSNRCTLFTSSWHGGYQAKTEVLFFSVYTICCMYFRPLIVYHNIDVLISFSS